MDIDLEPELRRRLGSADRNGRVGGMRHLSPDSLTPSAVLVPVLQRNDGYAMLLTRRSQRMRDHAGQIAFPGGRMEVDDRTSRETALREAHEEIGLPPQRVQIVGRLMPYYTVTGYLIHPWVGLIREPPPWRPNAAEVDEIFEVPVTFLLDARNHSVETVERDGHRYKIYAMPYGGYHIWGATAGIIHQLYQLLRTDL
ncbi:8-oxo-dGTP pyrophosphatase MutT (NUDIX family) [Natronocella acetinitrilica]|uniref:8-oxo-dGTP pyrophosphatase MutT (NUDIX family) n=1 Tax=Natronocella acetinitrilica TaxID=414046 RepID=A0AAE3G881_9GAMM|nr:8-oxo-dGTP pyrophosphatase MutT (NUDIX family) [Natronocella acetinitrilica]